MKTTSSPDNLGPASTRGKICGLDRISQNTVAAPGRGGRSRDHAVGMTPARPSLSFLTLARCLRCQELVSKLSKFPPSPHRRGSARQQEWTEWEQWKYRRNHRGARGIGPRTCVPAIRNAGRHRRHRRRRVARTAAELGDGVLGIPFDVRDPDAFAAFLDRAEDQLGRLDVLINNAGVAPIGLFVDEDPADTQRLLDINLGAVPRALALRCNGSCPGQRSHRQRGVLGRADRDRRWCDVCGHQARRGRIHPRHPRRDPRHRVHHDRHARADPDRHDQGVRQGSRVRIVGPDAVGDAIVGAVRTGRERYSYRVRWAVARA